MADFTRVKETEKTRFIATGVTGPAGPAVSPLTLTPIVGPIVDFFLQDHITDPTPHTAYDVDMQDLRILFENQLV
jgi:hypothetical protein